MKKGKRILAAVIALYMSVGPSMYLVGTEEVYAAVGVSGDYIYKKLTENTIEIAKYLGSDVTLEIPGEIDGKKVVGIGDSAFGDSSKLKEVNIPNGVVSIGEGAFRQCTELKKVSIPNGVVSIGEEAFNWCLELAEVNIPESVADIGRYAFATCANLQEIHIPGSILSIDIGTFDGCESLQEIDISNGVNSIEDLAFAGCSGLQEITIPSSVQRVNGMAFYGCNNLWTVNVDAGNADYISDDGVLYNKDMTELVSYPGGRTESGLTTFPASIKKIGYGAFGGSKLQEINIPNGVSSIEDFAFSGCYLLQEIRISGSVASIGTHAFSKCSKLTVIYVDTGNLNYASNDGILYSKDMEELLRCPEGKSGPLPVISSNVKKIGDNAFRDCTWLHEINIPNGVTNIGDGAFTGCTGLQGINIPNGVTNIGNEAFADCTGLQRINIPSGVSNIRNRTFTYCVSLQEINIPSGVSSIGNEAFLNCAQLKEINIADGVARLIGDSAFESCGLERITLPASVSSIGDFVFGENSSLSAIDVDADNPYYTSEDGVLYSKDRTNLIRYPGGKKDSRAFTIPSSVKSIAEGAFYGTSLNEISIPDGVVDIGSFAFCDCRKLQKINIPNGVSIINEGIFSNCLNLKEIGIPKIVRSIGTQAFWGCTSLVSIVIPDSVTTIEEGAFSICKSLKTVYYLGAKEQWDNIDIIIKWWDNIDLVMAKKFFNVAADSLSQEFVYRTLDNGKAEIVRYQGTDTTVEIPTSFDGREVESIGEYAFEGCSQITEISIPDSVSSIKSSTFNGCTSLAKVHIPDSVSSIQDNAFLGCDSIQDIYFKGTKKQWNNTAVGSEGNDALLKAQIHCQKEPSAPEESVLPETADTKQELEKLKDGDALSLEKDFQKILSDEQIDIIESCIYTWLAEINYAYKYTGDGDIKNRIMKKAGIDPDGNFTSGREQAVTHISVWTKYGPKTLEITLGLGQPDGNGSLYPSYGEMHYEILEKRSLPSDVPTSGRIGKDSYLDMETFINSAAKSSEDSLHGTFRWQELESWMAANILADKTVSEIIGNKNGCFVNGTFIVYAKPLSVYSKKVTIACPVDVHVYSMDGTEAGSIVNNEPKGGSQNVQLAVEGDTKIVYLAGDDYYLNLCGTDTGTMKYEVEEIANEEVQCNVRFLELQLKKDMQYEGYVFRPLNIDSDLYALRTVGSTSKEVFYAAEDKQKQALSLFKRVEGLTLGRGSASVDAGRTVQMSASVLPMDASNPNLQWSTDNEAVATVDSSGMVTAVGAGRATVTVSTKDGSFLKQFCVIDVVGRTNKPGGNTGTNPGGSTGINPGGSTAVTPGSDNSGSGNPGSDSPNDTAKPPLEQEPTITSLFYVLQFNANGGTGLSRATMTLLSGDSPGIMPKAKRKGYTFNGWYTQQNGGTRISGDKPLEQAATLYAQWTKVTAPAKAAAPTLKSKKKGQIKVSLKKAAGVAGYQIAYSSSKKFIAAKTKTTRTSANVKTLTGLKAGKKYYVRVRAYKVDSTGSRIYGAYSAAKSVKIKGK